MGANSCIKIDNMTGQAGLEDSTSQTDLYNRLRHAEVIQKGLNLLIHVIIVIFFLLYFFGLFWATALDGQNDFLSL